MKMNRKNHVLNQKMKMNRKNHVLINDKPIKFGTIVPLIGGMSVANTNVTGAEPSFFLSYPGFESNDAHAVNYFKKTPYITINSETNELPDDQNDLFDDVDFVSAVCPCAGLSMLNANTSKGGKSRGSDAVQNEWMYKSARIVLEQIRPKVFWGENAPGLYTNMGAGVIEKLREIGAEAGYSMSVVKTNTFLHGIPQHRQRTFYFFWNNSEAPILNYYNTKAPHLSEYLSMIPTGASLMDKGFGLGDLTENSWVQFVKSKGWDMKKAINSPAITLLQLILREGWLEDAISWGEANEKKDVVKFCTHVQKKIADSKGFWDATPLVFNEATNAIIAKNAGIVHPNGERGITVREAMWLMGLPHDFELVDGHWNHICQNVPVSTAKDWTTEVVRFLKGEITEYGGSFVKQNNISQKIDYSENTIKSKVLF
jgi:site-specific DNA-cytosine methylase